MQLEETIAYGDVSDSDKAKAMLATFMIEGTLTSALGTVPNALKIIKANNRDFSIELLSTNKNITKILNQAKEFNVKNIIINDFKKYLEAKYKIRNRNIRIYNNFDEIDLFSHYIYFDTFHQMIQYVLGYNEARWNIKNVITSRTNYLPQSKHYKRNLEIAEDLQREFTNEQ